MVLLSREGFSFIVGNWAATAIVRNFVSIMKYESVNLKVHSIAIYICASMLLHSIIFNFDTELFVCLCVCARVSSRVRFVFAPLDRFVLDFCYICSFSTNKLSASIPFDLDIAFGMRDKEMGSKRARVIHECDRICFREPMRESMLGLR